MSAPSTTTRGSRRVPAGTAAAPSSGTSRRGTTRLRGAERPRALTVAGAVDAAALLVVLGATIVGLGPVWGSTGYLVPAVGGAVVGLAVAWLGAWRRWPAVTVLAVAVLAYVLFGGALALPADAIGGVVPSLTTVQDLLLGAVTGWKEFVTTVPPLHSFPDLAVVPYLLLLVTALVAGSVAWRAKHAAWALVPVLVAFVGVILLGTVIAAAPVAQGLVLGVVGLLWASWRVTAARMGAHQVTTEASRAATRRLWWHRVRTGAAMLAVGGVAAAFAGPALLPDEPRTVLRETVVPPLDLHEYVSPLTGFRKYAKDLDEAELFTVRGLPAGTKVRLATLDAYNGVVYDASSGLPGSGVYTRAGDEIATVATGTPTTLEVEVRDYAGVWVPDAGTLAGITYTSDRARELAEGTYYNSTTGTALTTAGLQPGDTYTLDTLVRPEPTEEDLRAGAIDQVAVPPLQKGLLPAALAGKAAQFMGEETDPVEQLFALRDGLVASGVFSSGLENQPPSRPGHSAERIDTLLADDEMVGDDEQFAVALALMANQAGIPARVVMGFYPDEKDPLEPGEPFTATGGDVHAWAEVPFVGYGWVPVTAIPDEDNKIEPEPKSLQVPKPPVLEDPEPPEEPAEAEAGKVDDEDDEKADSERFDWGTVVLVGVAVAVPLLLLALPIVLVLAYKARRRARRRAAERPVDRVSGGWREVLDAATDLGTPVPVGATRREGAGVIAQTFGATTTIPLAHRADATVFGAGEPTEQEIEAFWADVDGVVGGLRSSVNRRARLRAALSLRSVRAGRTARAGGGRWTSWFRRPPTAPTGTAGPTRGAPTDEGVDR
ncbi:transglutaminase-like domain-containing protein [Cellulosimicrobium marinum]|uniref:transglutaminase-like domain-containing protein n=1 Tax=Cellulosimicrobium marinum TaxID=1638992 RepID=UPI001E2BFA8E|nr:transglutaminase-like domain-containing protein [Cellulosimicrobium marinum]MCB7136835.1 transglutaminase-like domain-containing protein [Cellulosimicrobium marinum]